MAEPEPEPQMLMAESAALGPPQLVEVPAGTRVPGRGVELACAIFVTATATSDGFVIASELLDESGYGQNYEDAWEDFLTSLHDKYASLSKRAERLSPEDRKAFEALGSCFPVTLAR